uniref:Uncharacterized protein n=1 Tax=Vitis vinifera TaxID=29760 RepID=F6HHT3_VITVI
MAQPVGPQAGWAVQTGLREPARWAARIPPLWRQYFQNTQGLMFVVDNNDRDQVVEVRNELHRMLNEDELHDAVLLVFDSRAPVQPLVKGFTGGLDWLFNNNANKV